MALKTNLLLLLVVVVSCNCKPFGWGVGGAYKGKLEVGGKANADGKIGFQNGKVGGRGDAHGEAGVEADGGLRSYAYVGKFGVHSDTGYSAGAKMNADGGVNGAVGKGKSLLSLTGGGSKSASLTPDVHGNVGGDISLLSDREIEHLNELNRANLNNNQVYPEKPTTESFFD